jgi:hypothetical protein
VEDPATLGQGWMGFNFAAAFGRAVRIMNDAALQALGSYDGGRMLFIGLGTAVGSAHIAATIAASSKVGGGGGGNCPIRPRARSHGRLSERLLSHFQMIVLADDWHESCIPSCEAPLPLVTRAVAVLMPPDRRGALRLAHFWNESR